MKRLERPEKYLYLFCVDADAKDNDFLAVIDVNPDSATFGTIINTLDLGTKGNETHHFGYTDDRTQDLGRRACSRAGSGSSTWRPTRPSRESRRCSKTSPTLSGLSGPHSYYALPGRMLITFLGSAIGGLPAGMAEFTNDGKFIRRIEHPSEAPYGYDVAVKPGAEPDGHDQLHAAAQLQEAAGPDGPERLRQRAGRLGLQEPPAASGGQGRPGTAGGALEPETREQLRLHQLRPR